MSSAFNIILVKHQTNDDAISNVRDDFTTECGVGCGASY